MTIDITPEMIAAWRTLQLAAAGHYRLQPQVRKAINVLDNSHYMVPIQTAEEEAYVPTSDPQPDDAGEDEARRQEERDAATLAAGGEVHLTRIPLSELTGEGLARALRKGRNSKN